MCGQKIGWFVCKVFRLGSGQGGVGVGGHECWVSGLGLGEAQSGNLHIYVRRGLKYRTAIESC